ncbi:hypothetical protein V493_08488 [Pseudogymnoascus sp. VKM F-4281 (FW-2241)]|nr:hypothetical protein V493_08488 [Pseudogymnoascus sp. VKM F-4281 (FW-2241)]
MPPRAPPKDRSLYYPHSRKQLHRDPNQDREGVEELHCVDEFVVLREVADDFDGGLVAEGGVAEGADRGEEEGD